MLTLQHIHRWQQSRWHALLLVLATHTRGTALFGVLLVVVTRNCFPTAEGGGHGGQWGVQQCHFH